MDSLNRKPEEKFHTWARRIHNRYLSYGYFWDAPYPKSTASVNKYIRLIQNAIKCYNCGRYVIGGVYRRYSLEYRWEQHQEDCDFLFKFEISERIDASIIIQRAWRRRKFIRSCKIRFLQKKILEWLYRPNGQLMKRAEERYYNLAITQH